MREAIRVYVLDGQPTRLQAIETLLKRHGFNVQRFAKAADLFGAVQSAFSQCLVVDAQVPEMHNWQFLKQLRSMSNAIIVVSDDQSVETVRQGMKAGALDVLLSPLDEEQLVSAVTMGVARSQRHSKVRRVIHEWRVRFDTLTDRERQVLQCVVSGMLNKNISSDLGISTKTVELHRANIMRKTHSRTLADLVKKYTLIESASTIYDSEASQDHGGVESLFS